MQFLLTPNYIYLGFIIDAKLFNTNIMEKIAANYLFVNGNNFENYMFVIVFCYNDSQTRWIIIDSIKNDWKRIKFTEKLKNTSIFHNLYLSVNFWSVLVNFYDILCSKVFKNFKILSISKIVFALKYEEKINLIPKNIFLYKTAWHACQHYLHWIWIYIYIYHIYRIPIPTHTHNMCCVSSLHSFRKSNIWFYDRYNICINRNVQRF